MSEFSYDTTEIEGLIRSFLPKPEGFQKTVYLAMNEAVENGGKRIRPILIFETCRCFAEAQGKDAEVYTPDAAPFMAAMEMIHTFSLIHDDLPCMDNDTLRRGKPTTWYKYGEDMAVLAGDALVLQAFITAAAGARHCSDRDRAVRALEILAQKSGMKGMIGGQTVDVEQTGKPLDKDQLDFIYRLKTGALIEASMMIGAVLGGATEKETEIMEKIAADVGIAFQIRDDILDETSTEAELGKPIHSDEKNEKTTYVTLYGLERAEKKAAELTAEAEQMLSKIPGDTGTLKGLIRWLLNRKK